MPRRARPTASFPSPEVNETAEESPTPISSPPPSPRPQPKPKPAPTPRKAERDTREVNIGDENFAHMFVGPAAGLIVGQIPVSAYRYRPTDAEMDAVLRPLERIALRRIPVDLRNKAIDELDPDKRDLALAAGGLLGYATRVLVTDYGTPYVADAGSGGPRRATRGSESRATAVPTDNSGASGGASTGGSAANASPVNPHAVAEAIMSDLWQQTYKPVDSGPGEDA